MNRFCGTQQHEHARPLACEGRACECPEGIPPQSTEDERYLRALAGRLRETGLAAAALLWLASLRPLSFLGSQVLHVAAPLLDVVVPGQDVSRLARILEQRANLDLLLDSLEADHEPPTDQAVSS